MRVSSPPPPRLREHHRLLPRAITFRQHEPSYLMWQPTSTDIDLEAQIVTGTHAPVALPTPPSLARAAAAPTRTPEHGTDPIDDFFGVTRPRATYESRHDLVSVSRVSVALDGEAPPPPYMEGAELPAYVVAPRESPTLAMYLFKFGFCESISPSLWSALIPIVLDSVPPILVDGCYDSTLSTESPRRLRALQIRGRAPGARTIYQENRA